MEIFLDTANLDEIKEIVPWGIISGLTTNQKIFSKEKGVNFREHVSEILSLVEGPISIEAPANDVDGIVEAAREYSSWDEKIVVKVPMLANGDGMQAVSILKEDGIKTNVTVLMSTNQVLLAALAGATYASIFFNRVRDYGDDAERVVRESRAILDRGDFETKIIAGSIRKPEDVVEIAVAGAHVITIPYKILVQMPYHQKTVETLEEFDKAWEEFKRSEKGE
jgi:transaldolase